MRLIDTIDINQDFRNRMKNLRSRRLRNAREKTPKVFEKNDGLRYLSILSRCLQGFADEETKKIS